MKTSDLPRVTRALRNQAIELGIDVVGKTTSEILTVIDTKIALASLYKLDAKQIAAHRLLRDKIAEFLRVEVR